MAAKSLLPGFGGKYTSEAIVGGATGLDTIDCSLVGELAFQVTGQAGDSTTVTVKQSFDGVHFGAFTTFSSAVGTIKLMQTINAGPFGILQLSLNGTTGGNTIIIVGSNALVKS